MEACHVEGDAKGELPSLDMREIAKGGLVINGCGGVRSSI